MKCIKDKCEYCVEKDFRPSQYSCSIGRQFNSFNKDKDVDCIIEDSIESYKNAIIELETYKKYIKDNQLIK